jgi:16S rRNA G966 N2-methylase RsmD
MEKEKTMSRLQRLEKELDALTDSLTLLPPFLVQIKQGNVLIAIKEECLISGVSWLGVLKRKGWRPRTAQSRMQLARNEKERNEKDTNKVDYAPASAHKPLTAEQYVAKMRKANSGATQQAIEEERKEMAAKAPAVPEDKRYCLFHADAQTFNKWPDVIDLIATDPPWKETALYEWLGGFAVKRLKPGGLLICQSCQAEMDKHIVAIKKSGLTNHWTMAIFYKWCQKGQCRSGRAFLASWRPVLVFRNGRFDRKGLTATLDAFIVRASSNVYHKWQQPLEPWQHWLNHLSLPGFLIADPFAGSATNGVAIKSIGGRRFIGTEIDKTSYEVAKVRLAETKEGSYQPKCRRT